MFELILLAIYTVVILAFVPGEKIAAAQRWVHKQIDKLKNSNK